MPCILTNTHLYNYTDSVIYHIQEWHKFTAYDILQNQYNYTNVCLLIYTAHGADRCIKVCGKWIFDSDLELELPLTSD